MSRPSSKNGRMLLPCTRKAAAPLVGCSLSQFCTSGIMMRLGLGMFLVGGVMGDGGVY